MSGSRLARLHRELARLHEAIAQELDEDAQAEETGVRKAKRRRRPEPRPMSDNISELAEERARRILGQ